MVLHRQSEPAAQTGKLGSGTVLVAIAKRLRNDLELILIHHVPDLVRFQHLHGDAVILKNPDQISNVGDVFRRRVLEPRNRFIGLSVVRWF
jgi:hypothetical protein